MQGQPTPIRLPASLDPTETRTDMKLFSLQPFESPDLAAFSAQDFIQHIIDMLAPYYCNTDDLTVTSPTPAIDLNNLMTIADLRLFTFGPRELMAAAKARPEIARLIGLPFTFFYSPDGSRSMLTEQPWLYLQVTAEQMTQLTGKPTSNFTLINLYPDTPVAVRKSPVNKAPTPLSSLKAIPLHATTPDLHDDLELCSALGLPSLEDLEYFVTNPISDADAALSGARARRFSRLPADYAPGTELPIDDRFTQTTSAPPREHSESSGSGSDLTTTPARNDSKSSDMLTPFARTRLGNRSAQHDHGSCCTIS